MTLGWPQFAMLVVSLFALSVTLAIVLVFDVSEFLSRLDVQQHEQKLGFELGLAKGLLSRRCLRPTELGDPRAVEGRAGCVFVINAADATEPGRAVTSACAA